MTIVTTVRELEAPYGEPIGRSLTNEIDHISDHYRGFIEHAPFVVVATSGPGFVRVQDANTVLLPDRRGNNRLDTLKEHRTGSTHFTATPNT